MRKAKKFIPVRLRWKNGKVPRLFRDLRDDLRAEWHGYSGWVALVTLDEYHEAIVVGAEDIIIEKSSFVSDRLKRMQ